MNHGHQSTRLRHQSARRTHKSARRRHRSKRVIHRSARIVHRNRRYRHRNRRGTHRIGRGRHIGARGTHKSKRRWHHGPLATVATVGGNRSFPQLLQAIARPTPLRVKSLPQSAPANDPPLECRTEAGFAPPEFDLPPGTGDGRIDQFSRNHRLIRSR